MRSQNRRRKDQRFSVWRVFLLFCLIRSVLCYWVVNSAYADDYFDRITIASNGRLTRFNREQLMIHADAIPLEAEQAKVYRQALIRSLELWEKATQGKLRFQFVPAAVVADIRIQWARRLSQQGKYENIGEAMLVRKAEGFHVEIEISLRNQKTLKSLAPEIVQAALLHEIGHAIGLWGHSEDPNDVMYFAATAQAPTARDITTWLKMREVPVNAPFHDQAVRVLNTEIQKYPKIANSHYLLGVVYADRGDYRLAIEAFQRALEIDPLLRISAVQIARIMQERGMYDLAIAHYRQALKVEPSAEVLGALGTLLLLQGDFGQAVNFCEQALRLVPDSVALDRNLLVAYHRWGSALLKNNQVSEAIHCFNCGLGRFPFSEILLYDLAVAHESAGKHQAALDIYQRILQIDSGYTSAKIGIATTLNNLGAQHAHNKDWDRAILCYQRALEYDPGCRHAYQNLKSALMRIGWEQNTIEDVDGAILTYQKLLGLDPEDAQAYNNLGIIYFNKQEYEESIACFEAALALDASYEEAQTNLDHVKKQQVYDTMKRALGPVLVALLVSFLMMKMNAKQVGSCSRLMRQRWLTP